jgi:hypothetical protein
MYPVVCSENKGPLELHVVQSVTLFDVPDFENAFSTNAEFSPAAVHEYVTELAVALSA